MLRMFAVNWWIVGIRGVITILFGLTAILWPTLTLSILIAIFGLYAIIDGVFTIVMSIAGRKERPHSWLMALDGVVRIGAGLIAVIWPGLTSLALVLVIAIWAVVTGIIEIVMAVRLRKEIENEWVLGLGGVLSILLGIVLFAQPGIGALAGVSLIGFYAILFGILLIVFAVKMQKRKKSLEQLVQEV